MSKTVKKLSPFALGLALCCYQAIQLPTAYAASLNLSSPPSDGLLSSGESTAFAADSTGKTATTDSTKTSVTANIDCPLQSSINQSTSTSSTPANPATTEASGVTPLPISPENSALKYESDDKVASSDTAQDSSIAQTPQTNSSTEVNSSEPVLMAQATLDDCCGIGGTTTCEVGGLPTGGAAVGGLSPLLGLLGLLPAAAIPFALGDSNDNPAQVPEPSTTPGIVAGFGLMGLYFSRRYLNRKNRQNTFSK